MKIEREEHEDLSVKDIMINALESLRQSMRVHPDNQENSEFRNMIHLADAALERAKELKDDRMNFYKDLDELSKMAEKAGSSMAIEMSELYLENQFLVGQWNYLEGRLAQANAQLLKSQLDVRLTLEVSKLSNDLEIIKTASTYVNALIFSHIEIKFGGGKRFKFCRTLEQIQSKK